MNNLLHCIVLVFSLFVASCYAMDNEPQSPASGTNSIMDTVYAVADGVKAAAIFAVCVIGDSPTLVGQSLGFYSDEESHDSQYENRLTRNPSFPSFTDTHRK
jgi:hypothetical protein